MAPPQASSRPLWLLSSVCHWSVWPVQCTVYTWSWHQTSDGQGCHCINKYFQKVSLTMVFKPLGKLLLWWSCYFGNIKLSIVIVFNNIYIEIHKIYSLATTCINKVSWNVVVKTQLRCITALFNVNLVDLTQICQISSTFYLPLYDLVDMFRFRIYVCWYSQHSGDHNTSRVVM